MFQLLSITVAASFIAGSYGQGVCENYDTDTSCIAVGCTWDSKCVQPPECGVPQTNNPSTYDTLTYEYDGVISDTGVVVNRYPLAPEVARLCDMDTECSAKYTLTLTQKFVTGNNCNDYGALPPHGVNQIPCVNVSGYVTDDMKNYINYPFPDDGVKQSAARGARSVTALTEPGYNCSSTKNPLGNPQCAFPLGFKQDTILKNLGICITVTNAANKWIEFMASSREGSNGGSYCVRDRNAAMNSEEACTPSGDLIDIRESGISASTRPLNLILFAQDNNDDAQIEVLWRLTSSHMTSSNKDTGIVEEKDDEDWSLYRNGGDYPASLMDPYPEGYDGEPIFQTKGVTSASSTCANVFLVLTSALVAMFYL